MVRSLIDHPVDTAQVVLPDGFRMVPWTSSLVREHAKVKYESFRNEMDASVFPCLGRRDGCLRLMKDLSNRSDFVPEATWLALGPIGPAGKMLPVGTIQGLRVDADKGNQPGRENYPQGSIQNIGIIPSARAVGLGTTLLHFALTGFQKTGCKSVSLEVTCQNTAAIRLYQRMRFSTTQTVFKVAEIPIN